MHKTVSHHMLRRTARKKARKLNDEARAAGGRGMPYYGVEEAKRGPWRWRVVAL